MVADVDLAGRKVGPGYPCFIIAEAGVNHDGDVGLAYKLIDVAVKAGASLEMGLLAFPWLDESRVSG